jgi:hypothetical protein
MVTGEATAEQATYRPAAAGPAPGFASRGAPLSPRVAPGFASRGARQLSCATPAPGPLGLEKGRSFRDFM